ncbi:unnamed protein product, partial [Musa hybrid cultivar]
TLAVDVARRVVVASDEGVAVVARHLSATEVNRVSPHPPGCSAHTPGPGHSCCCGSRSTAARRPSRRRRRPACTRRSPRRCSRRRGLRSARAHSPPFAGGRSAGRPREGADADARSDGVVGAEEVLHGAKSSDGRQHGT